MVYSAEVEIQITVDDANVTYTSNNNKYHEINVELFAVDEVVQKCLKALFLVTRLTTTTPHITKVTSYHITISRSSRR